MSQLCTGVILISEEPLSCAEGEVFSSVTHKCASHGTLHPCHPQCDPCQVNCDRNSPGTVEPDPFTCGIYHVCLADGSSLPEYCPTERPYYDYVINTCTSDEKVCYDYCDPCVPHCSGLGSSQVSDPYNCHMFYVCDPPYMSYFECPDGGVFDNTTESCDQMNECVTWCGIM